MKRITLIAAMFLGNVAALFATVQSELDMQKWDNRENELDEARSVLAGSNDATDVLVGILAIFVIIVVLWLLNKQD